MGYNHYDPDNFDYRRRISDLEEDKDWSMTFYDKAISFIIYGIFIAVPIWFVYCLYDYIRFTNH